MLTLQIENIYTTVYNANQKQLNIIDEALSVQQEGHEFSNAYQAGMWDGKTRFFEKGRKRFPTGLLAEAVYPLKRAGYEVEIEDNRKIVEYTSQESITLKHEEKGTITLRDYQMNAVNRALEYTRGVINVATNGGKTEIAAGIIKMLLPKLKKGQRILFFTDSKEIFSQSYKRLNERLGMKVGKIGSGTWDEGQVTVVMIPTIRKYISMPRNMPSTPKKGKLNKEKDKLLKGAHLLDGEAKALLTERVKQIQEEISEIEKNQRTKYKEMVAKTKKLMDSSIGFIADEVHHASSDTWYKLFMKLKNCYYRIGLTGTIDRSNKINVNRLYGTTGRVLCKVSNKELIDKGHSAKPIIYMMKIPKCYPIMSTDYRMVRNRGIISCEARNKLFVNKVVERVKSGKKCLIITMETAHGNIVTDMLKEKGVNYSFTYGDLPDAEREKALSDLREGNIDALVATSVLDEGVDVSNINCIFLMAGGKSMRQVLQRIGRGLRKKEDGSCVEVYDALDYHHAHLTNHTTLRYEIYKSEGFKVQKL